MELLIKETLEKLLNVIGISYTGVKITKENEGFEALQPNQGLPNEGVDDPSAENELQEYQDSLYRPGRRETGEIRRYCQRPQNGWSLRYRHRDGFQEPQGDSCHRIAERTTP